MSKSGEDHSGANKAIVQFYLWYYSIAWNGHSQTIHKDDTFLCTCSVNQEFVEDPQPGKG